ncbi:uncharacterized protein LOC129895302 [Solanum dulcamara]|uniref:uncharacterized protein LOC129895302 n=1 Tax=Solanum dulcamara TaxID=45834 RepID=UPI002485A8F0|nr:uncharacterized protein LOC129895302 [Solanum dulcamara]
MENRLLRLLQRGENKLIENGEATLMDRQKKRKRTENGGANGVDRSRHERESAVKENSAVSTPPPSEAEVDEFFAILRRMNVAVKYLQKNAQINNTACSHKRVVPRVDLDLNTLPESGD